MNIPNNDYMKKIKQLAKDGKIKSGEYQNLLVIHEGWYPNLRDPKRNNCLCRPEIRGLINEELRRNKQTSQLD